MQPFDVETPAAAVRTRRFVAPVVAAAGVVGVVLLAGPPGGERVGAKAVWLF